MNINKLTIALFFCIGTHCIDASELEQAVSKAVGTMGLQLFNQLRTRVYTYAPAAQLSYANRMIIIKHDGKIRGNHSLACANDAYGLFVHTADEHTIIMRFELNPCFQKPELL